MSDFVGWDSKKIENAIGENCMTPLQEVADLVADEARRRCPVNTGALRDSIRTARKKDAKDIWIIAGNKKVYYARFVEYGTVNSPAKPFMRPALKAAKARAKAIVEGK